MTNIKGYLIECDGRSLFIRDREQIGWAIDDHHYQVTPLVPLPPIDELSPEQENPVSMTSNEVKEQLKLMNDLFELEEKEIGLLKEQLTEFVEAVEAIHEFSSKVTDNTLEMKGLLKLIAETCGNLLRGRQE